MEAQYPNIAKIASDANYMVSGYLDVRNGDKIWVPKFKRNLNEKEERVDGIVKGSRGGDNRFGRGRFHLVEFGGQWELFCQIGNLSSLTNLILWQNSLQGPIPSELGNLHSPLNFQLSLNKLTGKIPSILFNISSLIVLSMAGNRISGQLPSDLFLAMPNLVTLFVGGNLFHGPIPASISNGSQLLRQLDLSNSSLSGFHRWEIFKGFKF